MYVWHYMYVQTLYQYIYVCQYICRHYTMNIPKLAILINTHLGLNHFILIKIKIIQQMKNNPVRIWTTASLSKRGKYSKRKTKTPKLTTRQQLGNSDTDFELTCSPTGMMNLPSGSPTGGCTAVWGAWGAGPVQRSSPLTLGRFNKHVGHLEFKGGPGNRNWAGLIKGAHSFREWEGRWVTTEGLKH